MPKNFRRRCVALMVLSLIGCASGRSGEKGAVRKAIELPVNATEKGIDKSYSAIDKKVRLPGGNRAPMREQQLPIYYEGSSNLDSLQRD